MGGYTKNIAVIKALKGGFSADGGALSGLVKAEKYGGFFRAEVTLINFAPLSSGRYVVGISDGVRTVVCNGLTFEGNSDIDTSCGFAALVCFVCGEVSPVASAVCGDYAWALSGIAREIGRQEGESSAPAYEDEAIAEENYYEYGDAYKGGGAVCEVEEQKERKNLREDEADFCLREEQESSSGGENADGKFLKGKNVSRLFGEEAAQDIEEPSHGIAEENKTAEALAQDEAAFHHFKEAEKSDKNNSLGENADGKDFYSRMRAEIERLLSDYPREEGLEHSVKGSRWVRINYGGDKYYVFGVIYEGEKPAYVCYGVPSKNSSHPPKSLEGMAGYIPAGHWGFWVMYQDAATGQSVKMQ